MRVRVLVCGDVRALCIQTLAATAPAVLTVHPPAMLLRYVSYSGAAHTPERKEAEAFLLSHFAKAKALGDWLMFRYNKSLAYPANHPSYGIPAGRSLRVLRVPASPNARGAVGLVLAHPRSAPVDNLIQRGYVAVVRKHARPLRALAHVQQWSMRMCSSVIS